MVPLYYKVLGYCAARLLDQVSTLRHLENHYPPRIEWLGRGSTPSYVFQARVTKKTVSEVKDIGDENLTFRNSVGREEKGFFGKLRGCRGFFAFPAL